MSRPPVGLYMMGIAQIVATRATCCRRSVGCVLVNKHNHIIATGYNGVAAGRPHCTEAPCPGANAPSGQSLDLCQALHAEQNALLQCKDMYDIEAAYVTASPCVTCLKLLLNTSCKAIYFIDEYPHAAAKQMWVEAGRQWRQISLEGRDDLRNVYQLLSEALAPRSGALN